MKAMNLGCGPDIKEGWVNVDIVSHPNIEYWDAVDNVVPKNWEEHFDFILVNHTLCLLTYDEVDIVLRKLYSMLKKGGILQVIDMDLMKAIKCHSEFDFEGLFNDGTPPESHEREERLCKHLVGYGRKSIYTAYSMATKIERAGFTVLSMYADSTHDLRPKESLIVEAVK